MPCSGKAKSKNQQEFMGMVYAAKKGKKPASPAVAEVAKSMTTEEAHGFAKTKRKGLPEKKAENLAINVEILKRASRILSSRKLTEEEKKIIKYKTLSKRKKKLKKQALGFGAVGSALSRVGSRAGSALSRVGRRAGSALSRGGSRVATTGGRVLRGTERMMPLVYLATMGSSFWPGAGGGAGSGSVPNIAQGVPTEANPMALLTQLLNFGQTPYGYNAAGGISPYSGVFPYYGFT